MPVRIEAPEAMRRLRPAGADAKAAAMTDPVAQTLQGTTAMPAPTRNFKGITFASGGYAWPPDPNGDVGPNHYVQAVNTSIQIFYKDGTPATAPQSFNSLFAGALPPCNTSNRGDVIVVYDRLADRWLAADFAWASNQGPFYECIAVSKTSDPVAGGWWLYAMKADGAQPTRMNDYPKFGVWADGYYMSANMFAGTSGPFQGARVWALNRGELTSGQTLHPIAFDVANDGGLLPANVRGTFPEDGSDEVFADLESNAVHLWRFHADWTEPSNSTFTGPISVPVAAYSLLPSAIPQSGSSETLDQLNDRLMMQAQYRRIGDAESLWLNHTVASGGAAAIRWYEIQDPNGTAVLGQQGTYQPDELHRWMGSLAVDGAGNMALGFSVSSSSMYPAVRYAGRLSSDPVGQLLQEEGTVVAGSGAQNGGHYRWGDYSAMTVDPVDDCTFWYTTEYYETTGSNWQTRVAAFAFPGCVPRVPFLEAVAPTRVHRGSGAFTLTVTGRNFVAGDTVLWNGAPRQTTFVSGSELRASMVAGDVAAAGTAQVTVKTAAGPPGAAASFTVLIVGLSSGADFNADGRADLVWRNYATGANVVWYMDGAAASGGASLSDVSDPHWQMAAVADLNTDGKADVVWRNVATGENVVWFMNGTAIQSWGMLPTVADARWEIVAAADFDNDGNADLVWRNSTTGLTTLWYVNGTGLKSWTILQTESDLDWRIVGAADFNGDRSPDLVWWNIASGTARVWYMNGETVTGTASLDSMPVITWQPAAVGDFDGNDTPDIVWRNSVTGELWLWTMSGVTRTAQLAMRPVTDTNWAIQRPLRRQGIGDVNGDGHTDLVLRNPETGENRVWFMNATTLVTSADLIPVAGLDWKIAAVADFNGDGCSDVVWRNPAAGYTTLWYLNGVTLVGWTVLSPTVDDPAWEVVGAGDLNGDGQSDLVWRNTATNEATVWFMNGATLVDWAMLDLVADPHWKIAAVADFDGDGKGDLLWWSETTGMVLVWYMDGALRKGWEVIETQPDTSWQPAAAGDFNRDGKPDIAWRNYRTGDNMVWYLDGAHHTGTAMLDSLPDTNWTIIRRR